MLADLVQLVEERGEELLARVSGGPSARGVSSGSQAPSRNQASAECRSANRLTSAQLVQQRSALEQVHPGATVKSERYVRPRGWHNVPAGVGRVGWSRLAALKMDLWGLEEPPAVAQEVVPPLPPRLAALASSGARRMLGPDEQFVLPHAAELPEVQALIGQGWVLAVAGTEQVALAAVWPRALRCWVADRLPRVRLLQPPGARWVEPATGPTPIELLDARRIARVGLPAAPPGRIWLLRSPWPSVPYRLAVRVILARAAERRGGRAGEDRMLVEAAREVLGWGEDRMWSWWPGQEGRVARAWRARGRVDAGVVPLVVAGVDPEELAGYARWGIEESQAVAWALALAEEPGVRRPEVAAAWRRLGVDPERARELHQELPPDRFASYRALGLSVAEARRLCVWPLEVVAGRLREGMPPDAVAESLLAEQAARRSHPTAP